MQPVNFYNFFVLNTNQAVNLQNVSDLFSDKNKGTPAEPAATVGAPPPPNKMHQPIVEVHRAKDGSYLLAKAPVVEVGGYN